MENRVKTGIEPLAEIPKMYQLGEVTITNEHLKQITDEILTKKENLKKAVAKEDYEKAADIKLTIEGLLQNERSLKEQLGLLNKDIAEDSSSGKDNLNASASGNNDSASGNNDSASGNNDHASGNNNSASGKENGSKRSSSVFDVDAGSSDLNKDEVGACNTTSSPTREGGIPLIERIMVQYKTSSGETKERKKKRSVGDMFYWDEDLNPQSRLVRDKFNKGHLPENMYNFSIDTHTPMAITYIDPLTEKVYYAGSGECLDFLKIPEDRVVVWKPPKHPQSGIMSPSFCRALPFNKVEQIKTDPISQIKKPWMISDLGKSSKTSEETPETSKQPTDSQNISDASSVSEDSSTITEDSDMFAGVSEQMDKNKENFTPVFMKSRNPGQLGSLPGRGGGKGPGNRGGKSNGSDELGEGSRGRGGVQGRGRGGGRGKNGGGRGKNGGGRGKNSGGRGKNGTNTATPLISSKPVFNPPPVVFPQPIPVFKFGQGSDNMANES